MFQAYQWVTRRARLVGGRDIGVNAIGVKFYLFVTIRKWKIKYPIDSICCFAIVVNYRTYIRLGFLTNAIVMWVEKKKVGLFPVPNMLMNNEKGLWKRNIWETITYVQEGP